MARGNVLPGVLAPIGIFRDKKLRACHPIASLVSISVRTLSNIYGDDKGWIDARHSTPGSILLRLGSTAGLLGLTASKVDEILTAMEVHGFLEKNKRGEIRMADHELLESAMIDYLESKNVNGEDND